MTVAAARRLAGALVAVACALAVVSVASSAPPEPQLAPAADTSQFRAGNIIADEVFYDSGAMTAAQVQAFLDDKGRGCRAASGGPACIKDYVMATQSQPADAYCPQAYQGASRETAATVIAKVARACGISPRVLLVMLQKETSQVTRSTPTAHLYQRAMGFGCPDNANGTCSAYYPGLFKQLYFAARQFKIYASKPTGYKYAAKRNNAVLYSPASGCGSSTVYIENQATASLYIYTPYQPNKAALAAGYAAANDRCSAYGNRNFWLYFTDWFGSTQKGGRDTDAPVGRLEVVADRGDSVRVRGWAYDPNSPAATVAVAVYAGGTKIGTASTTVARPDVAEANYGAGGSQGFDATFKAARGKQTVCVYPVNIGAGYSNPRLGCATVTVTSSASWNPKGRIAGVRVAGTRLVVEGWSFDPDAPTAASTVRVYAGSMRLGDVVAKGNWPDVGKYYPRAGSAHGFRLDTRLPKGKHRVCVYAINTGIGTGNPALGCQTVTVTAPPLVAPVRTGSPVGRMAAVALDGQDATISGWAFDPDAPTAPATVRIMAGDTSVGTAVAAGDWPDVQRYFPYAGSAHRFDWRGILPHGSYDLCLWGVDRGPGKDISLGCKAVTVIGDRAADPRGVLDPLEFSGGTVRADGWAYDPDDPTAPVTVRITRDGTTVTEIVADGNRPGLSTSDPQHEAAGNRHGYVWSGAWPAGKHTICAIAVNVRYGTGNTQLRWCRTETSPSTTALGTGSTPAPSVAARSASPDARVEEPTDPAGTSGSSGTSSAGTSSASSSSESSSSESSSAPSSAAPSSGP